VAAPGGERGLIVSTPIHLLYVVQFGTEVIDVFRAPLPASSVPDPSTILDDDSCNRFLANTALSHTVSEIFSIK